MKVRIHFQKVIRRPCNLGAPAMFMGSSGLNIKIANMMAREVYVIPRMAIGSQRYPLQVAAPTIMNNILCRVAGGRAAKLHLTPGLLRRKAYATAAVSSDERVRKTVEGQVKVKVSTNQLDFSGSRS